MATSNPNPTPYLTRESKKLLTHYCIGLLTEKRGQSDLFNKMEAIDKAYVRYKEQEDSDAGNTSCDVFSSDRVTPPIVVSQCDSITAYLAEVFLSGTPLFPVVSSPKNRLFAEQLETLMDDHAQLAGTPRQLLMFLRNAVRYKRPLS